LSYHADLALSASEQERAAQLLEQVRRGSPAKLSKAHQRFAIGGVSALHTEQWDYYKCGSAGRSNIDTARGSCGGFYEAAFRALGIAVTV